jgi:hypothetical protein
VQYAKRFHQKFSGSGAARRTRSLLKPKTDNRLRGQLFVRQSCRALIFAHEDSDEAPYQGTPAQCNSIHRRYVFGFFTSVVCPHKVGSFRL